jgi:hypothetical protein
MSDQSPKAPRFEIPDLELDAPVSRRAAPVSTSRLVAPDRALTAPLGLHGGDDFELIATGGSLELAGGIIEHDDAPRAADSKPWPTGRSRSGAQLPIDDAEVTRIADYGAAPRRAVLTPLYVYRVFSRRAPLKAALAAHNQELLQAEAARDRGLMELTDSLRDVLSQNEAFSRLLQPIGDVEKLTSERTAALAEAAQGLRAEMAKFDGEIARLREAESQASLQVAERRKASDEADDLRRRADAKHKRVHIEIRGVMDIARQAVGPGGGDIPAAQAAELAELQGRSSALEPELSAARTGHAAATAALESAETQQRHIAASIEQLERQKASATSALEQQVNARAAGVSDAEKQRRDALAEVARAVLAARGAVAVPETSLEALRAHDGKVESAAVRLETHVRALHSYDTERVRQGVILALSALGLLVLAILLKAVL